jgi:hypothetical protein
VTGERLSQAGWLGPSQAGSRGSGAEAGFTSSSDGVRAPSVTRKGTWRPGAMRNRSKPDQVTQAGFGLEPIAVTQRVSGCYCASARANDPGGFRKEVSQTKDAERRDKVERLIREGHAVQARPVKTFRKVGDVKNAPLTCERKAT